MRTKKLLRLDHGMLLDAKSIQDNALDHLEKLQALVPSKLHDELEEWKLDFEHELCQCDVSDRYEEKT